MFCIPRQEDGIPDFSARALSLLAARLLDHLQDLVGRLDAPHAGEDPVHEHIVDLLRVAAPQASRDEPVN